MKLDYEDIFRAINAKVMLRSKNIDADLTYNLLTRNWTGSPIVHRLKVSSGDAESAVNALRMFDLLGTAAG